MNPSKLPLRGLLMCMHYRIFTVDNGLEPACVTFACFVLQFHRFANGFEQ